MTFFTEVWVTACLLSFAEFFLCILADFSCAVGWRVKILTLIFRFPSLFSKFFGIVPRPPTTIGITVTLMIRNFFRSLEESMNLSSFSLFFTLNLWSAGRQSLSDD